MTYYLQNQTVVDAAGVPLWVNGSMTCVTAERLTGQWERRAIPGTFTNVACVNHEAARRNTPDTPISVAHAALRLNVSTTRVRKLLATGKLLGHKHGRDWQVNAASVADYRTKQLCRLRHRN
jgi:excisionase family DNA binding protein